MAEMTVIGPSAEEAAVPELASGLLFMVFDVVSCGCGRVGGRRGREQRKRASRESEP